MFRISHSKAKLARKCLKAYEYKYVKKLRKKLKSRPLTVGSLVHNCLEAYFAKGKYKQEIAKWKKQELSKMFKEEKVEFADVPELVTAMMEGYIARWKELGLTMDWVEHEFELEIAPGIELIGKIDGRASEKRKKGWLVEHKTAAKMPGEEMRIHDTQIILYAGVMEDLGMPPVTGVIWDYLRTKLPTQPKLLASGGLSTAKNQDTTYEVYLAAIKEHGFSKKGYADFLETLKDRRDSFFRQVRLPINKNMVTEVRKDIIMTSNILIELEDKGDCWPRNITRDCSWCDYKTLCLAELRGDDTSHLMKFDYEDKSNGSEEKKGKKVRRRRVKTADKQNTRKKKVRRLKR